MSTAEDYHDFTEPERDHVYVQTLGLKVGEPRWIDHGRVAPHGAERMILDGFMPSAWTRDRITTFRLTWDWGNGVAVIVDHGHTQSFPDGRLMDSAEAAGLGLGDRDWMTDGQHVWLRGTS